MTSTATQAALAKTAAPAKKTAKKAAPRRTPATKKAAPVRQVHPEHVDALQSITFGSPLAVDLNDLVRLLGRSGVTRDVLRAAAAELPIDDADSDLDPEQFELVVPVRVARENFKSIVDRAQEQPTLLTKHGKPVAAVVSADFYERAVAALEELADQAAVDRHDQREAAGEVKTHTSNEVDDMLAGA